MQSKVEHFTGFKEKINKQIKTRKKIISDFLKDLSLKEKQVIISQKTGINENTISRIKNNSDFITSFDNVVALYTLYPELNKKFLNQWIELSGLGSINEYEVKINGNITKNYDILPLLPNEVSFIKIPQNIFINFKPMIVYRWLRSSSLIDRQIFIFSKRGIEKNTCHNFFKFFPDKICLAISKDNKQYVGYLIKNQNDFFITNPITRKIYKDSSSINEVYRLIMTINDDWSMSAS